MTDTKIGHGKASRLKIEKEGYVGWVGQVKILAG